MKLDKKEINILSLIDEQLVNKFLEFAEKNTHYSREDINIIIKKLIDNNLIEIINIPCDKKDVIWYFRTKKGEAIRLNDNLRYISRFGDKFGGKKKK